MSNKKALPPVYLFLSIVGMVALHFLLPVARVVAFPWNILGAIPLAFGIALDLIADRAFKKVETTVKPFEQSTALVTTGVYRIGRHPMYLGMVLILLGLAVLLQSLTFLQHRPYKLRGVFLDVSRYVSMRGSVLVPGAWCHVTFMQALT